MKKHNICKLLENICCSKWCFVDIYNRFEFRGKEYIIDESVEEYTVEVKPVRISDDNWNEWENKAKMDKILVIELPDKKLKFYNEYIEEIKSKLIKQV